MKSIITAISHYEPEKIITNNEIAEICANSEFDWILGRKFIIESDIENNSVLQSNITKLLEAEKRKQKLIEKSERVWISQRRRVNDFENATTMAISAIDKMKSEYGNNILKWLDAIYFGTLTPSHFFPNWATQLQKHIWISGQIESFDILNACPSWLNWLNLADRAIRSGDLKKILVVASDTMSRMIKDYNYQTAILFWDAAWAAILEQSNQNTYGIQWSAVYSWPQDQDCLVYPTQFLNEENSKIYSKNDLDENHNMRFAIDWPTVYEKWVNKTVDMINNYLIKNKLSIGDFDYIIPHQANNKMLNSICELLNFSQAKMLKTININGNTAAASVPLTMSKNKDLFNKWDRILCVSFGAWFSLALTDIIRNANAIL